MKCVFSMRISVIFNFTNESRICCSSLELDGDLDLYVIKFKKLIMLLLFTVFISKEISYSALLQCWKCKYCYY